ncbi:hypothetical protein AT15_02050 [Kosmotoga arenicorallina S304]|uniref:Metallo-beta-lactamase domain-containing protein n=1 Tax=Kosmotoga arenicorallina S304 TaxID=1453497 RepID=A0A176JZP0_9BACT|nr:MBL fold metallo-hydrolase [Kosmotoga arenicorallina]OAA29479.1 hypothetical protein AT15_02050 [Kosmotoga arenicorallina S304]
MGVIIRIKSGITNLYLVKGKEGYLLIDAGYKFRVLEKWLKALNIGWEEIKFIFITHHHYDHTLALSTVQQHTNAILIFHHKERAALKTGFSTHKTTPLNFRTRVLMTLRGYSNSKPVAINDNDIVINEDTEMLRDFGIHGKILRTPGHTQGSISLLLDNGMAFVGDAAMNFFPLLGLKKRPLIAEDYEAVFKSWEKLLNAGAKKIYPSHGEPFSASELEKALQLFSKKEA